jgi:hypothetical protein
MLLPLISMATLAGRLRRFGHNSSGSAAVEFAMIAPDLLRADFCHHGNRHGVLRRAGP